jgi:hypothetical protein
MADLQNQAVSRETSLASYDISYIDEGHSRQTNGDNMSTLQHPTIRSRPRHAYSRCAHFCVHTLNG